MNVVITGANGFIGSHLVQKFIDDGDEVYAIVKDHNEDISHIQNCKHIIYCELKDLDSIVSLFKDVYSPIVYHLAWAGVNGKTKAEYSTQIQNIQMACDVATFSKKIDASCLLCAGTIAEKAIGSFGHLEIISGGQMYGVGKASTRLFLEALCKNISLSLVWMRFSNIYGPDNKTGNLISYTIGQLSKGEDATFGPANQPYDFIYVDDLIQAAYLLGKKKEHSCIDYFIGSGEPKLLKDYLIEVGEIYGKPELIKTGVRPDDGIKYSFEMFDVASLKEEIGNYISKSFDEAIRYTINHY